MPFHGKSCADKFDFTHRQCQPCVQATGPYTRTEPDQNVRVWWMAGKCWTDFVACGLMTRYMAVCVCDRINMCRMLYVCVPKGSARSVSFNYTTKPSCQHVHTHRAKRAWCQSMSRYRWSVCGLPQRHTVRLCGAANDVWKLARKMTFFLMESMYWAMLCHLFLSRSFIYLLHWQYIYITHAYWNYWKDTCYLIIRKILKVWR